MGIEVIANMKEIYYRLPVNLELVGIAMRNEVPDIIFYIDLATGGVFSLRVREDYDWERIGEGFDHSIDCGFRNESARFLGVEELSARQKQGIIEEYAAGLLDQVLAGRLRRAALAEKPFAAVIDEIKGRSAELCGWHAHLEQACLTAAAEFLQEYEISNEPAQPLTSHQVLEATLSVN